MPDHSITFEKISYRRIFPWLYITRAFWLAADPRKIALAATALILVSVGSRVIDRMPFNSSVGAVDLTLWPWEHRLGYEFFDEGRRPPFSDLLEAPGRTLGRAVSNWQVVLLPVRDMLRPVPILFRGNSSLSELADAATRILWSLVVWSIFGGAICRIAAVQFARDQQIGLKRALLYSLKKFFGYFSAPLMPVAALALLWFLCVIGGWIGRIPGAGKPILGALWGLELAFGFLMSIVLIGVSAGWPLMFATISVEGTDGFDGLSRAYNYIFERPLYVVWQLLVTLSFGSLAIFFVWGVAQVIVQLSVWGVAWGQGISATEELIGMHPAAIGGIPSDEAELGLGPTLAGCWMNALATGVVGFVYTFFWSAATIGYFVLRHSVDANDFDEVYFEEKEEDDDLLPLVGTAAMADSSPPVEAPPVNPPATPPVDLTP